MRIMQAPRQQVAAATTDKPKFQTCFAVLGWPAPNSFDTLQRAKDTLTRLISCTCTGQIRLWIHICAHKFDSGCNIFTNCSNRDTKCNVWALVYGLCNYLDDNNCTLLLHKGTVCLHECGLHFVIIVVFDKAGPLMQRLLRLEAKVTRHSFVQFLELSRSDPPMPELSSKFAVLLVFSRRLFRLVPYEIRYYVCCFVQREGPNSPGGNGNRHAIGDHEAQVVGAVVDGHS